MANTKDEQTKKGPVLDPALCRCCRTIKKCRLLNKEYDWMGKKEIYSDMIMDCFGLLLSHLDGEDKDNCICATCVSRLREASSFRKQVLYWEEAFLQAKLDMQKDEDKPYIDVKIELDPDEDVGRGESWTDDDMQNVSDSEDTKALSELKIEKSEEALKKPKLKKLIRRKVLRKSDDKTKKDTVLKRKLLSEMKKTKSKLNKQKQRGDPDAEVNAKRDAESIVQNTTAYPFRTPGGSGSTIQCVYCKKQFLEPKDFRSHMKEDHNTFNIKMSFQGLSLSYDYGKVDITDLQCRLCTKDFIRMEDVAEHLRYEHEVMLNPNITKGNLMPYKLKNMAHRCGICDASFLNVREVSKHMSTHFVKATCELCGKTYASEHTLDFHMIYCHNPKKFVCRMCRTGFDTKEEKDEHIRGSKHCYPFCCKECGERFILKRTKENHMVEVHGRKKTWPCGKCSKIFHNSTSLRWHFNVSHSNRYLACPYCEKKCPDKRSLNDHVVSHTKDSLFPCTVCSKSFPREKSLKNHMWNHTEKKRFECIDCDKKFNQKVSWKAHMKRYHPSVNI